MYNVYFPSYFVRLSLLYKICKIICFFETIMLRDNCANPYVPVRPDAPVSEIEAFERAPLSQAVVVLLPELYPHILVTSLFLLGPPVKRCY